MLVLIDNANIYEIERLYSMYPYDGVTTNPSILMNEHKNPIKVLQSIREFCPGRASCTHRWFRTPRKRWWKRRILCFGK